MSFFGGGSDDQAKLAQAKMEMEGMNEMFNKMSHMCFTKCVAKHNEAEMLVHFSLRLRCGCFSRPHHRARWQGRLRQRRR